MCDIHFHTFHLGRNTKREYIKDYKAFVRKAQISNHAPRRSYYGSIVLQCHPLRIDVICSRTCNSARFSPYQSLAGNIYRYTKEARGAREEILLYVPKQLHIRKRDERRNRQTYQIRASLSTLIYIYIHATKRPPIHLSSVYNALAL